MPRKRIKRGPIKKKTKGRIPSIEEPAHDDRLRMSFRRLDTAKADFSPDLCGDGYLRCFVERLRDVCHLTVHEFTTNLSKSLRIHPIDFDKTSQKAGFDHLNEQLRDLPAWQFEITKHVHGRVHGFLLENTFYVVWMDPKHKLYP